MNVIFLAVYSTVAYVFPRTISINTVAHSIYYKKDLKYFEILHRRKTSDFSDTTLLSLTWD